MSFYIKQNDTSPSMLAVLKDGYDVVIDLTGTTVRFHMRLVGSNTHMIDSSADIVEEDNGIVRYIWQTGDTSVVGSYEAEFEITYSDGSIETFPNNGYIAVEITGDIT
tara:strand:+ start:1287 stop:1610 length:324 start_codon:yes stop_codon:yes gene_type:complete